MRLIRILAAMLVPAAASAQHTTIRTATDLRNAPDGGVVAELRSGTPVAREHARGAWTEITLDGYLHTSVVRGKRQEYPISAADGATLRATPSRSGTPLARLREGMGLHRVSTTGEWVHVRRTAWVRTSALGGAQTTVAARTTRASAPDSVVSDSGSGALDSADTAPAAAFALEHRAALRIAPDGATLATLDSSTHVTTLARDRQWVRVRVEGWVQAADLVPADTSVLTAVSAADLRSDPDRYRGRTVRWHVQKIALQSADPLRKGMAPDEPYLLARGPGAENALLYLALPPSLVDQARRIDPLASMLITARVRFGRSDPSGVPLLDVLTMSQQ
ncbi:MAG: hypothetical protein ACREOJ_01945 [Gemmatimonadaceae bacterium]